MKAIILNEFGGTDKLIYADLPTPEINAEEVLIKVRAISINPVDVRTRAGSAMADHLKHHRPLILGWDISGTVVKMGSNVTKFKIGDDVFGMVNFLGHGKGYAEYVAAPAHHLALKPTNVSYEQAAAATLAALTAWQFLKPAVSKGDRIVIQAASGGVGHYAIQISKYLKAHVIGISSLRNKGFVLALGADEHVAYDKVQFDDIIKDVDIVIDAFAFDNLYKSLKIVKPGGKIISLLPMISEDVKTEAAKKNVGIFYSLVKSSGDDMNMIADLLKDGLLVSHISHVYSFSEMDKAHVQVESGTTVGKVVVTI
jgi:NADPH:quinone reductase-like Zn-dependent oxidoreductase